MRSDVSLNYYYCNVLKTVWLFRGCLEPPHDDHRGYVDHMLFSVCRSEIAGVGRALTLYGEVLGHISKDIPGHFVPLRPLTSILSTRSVVMRLWTDRLYSNPPKNDKEPHPKR